MTVAFQKAARWRSGRPAFPTPAIPAFRKSGFTFLLLCTTALAGCATAEKPPEISYDDAAPAVRTVDPPVPVKVVELPKVLPLPGQLKPVGKDEKPSPELPDPAARVTEANAAARMQPVRNGFINAIQVYPFVDGALYQVYTSPGQITDIALQPGEQLVGSGPVAAGDTVRWIIGDTESGAGATKQVHILVKPTRAELMTNLVINTNARTYHMELRSTEKTYMASVSWQYPQDQLIALRRQNAEAQAAQPVATGIDLSHVNFRYDVTGDHAPWRPLRAFDDGRQVFIEFPRGIGQGEMPPLFVVGPEGDTSELVNYRVRDNYMIVDRLFAAAELRFGSDKNQKRVRVTRTDGVRNGPFSWMRSPLWGFASDERPERQRRASVVSEIDSEKDKGPGPNAAAQPDVSSEDDARPLTGEPVAPMRLRAEPPRVTRLSRKVLAGLGIAAGVGIGGALIYALQTQHSNKPGEELYSTDNRSTPDGLASLPKDYAGVPRLGPPLPGDLGRPILNAQTNGKPVPVPGIGAPGGTAPAPSAEEQRRLQELDAARTARLFASTDTRPTSTSSALSAAATTPPTDLASLGLAPQPATPSAQDRQLTFLNQTPDKRTVSPDRVAAPASANVLQAGAIIPAALITGIRSDLPGQITAQVMENVYDSPTGHILLVPQGTRIIGQYDNGVGFGQRRVLLVWNRLIFPNGRSIVLERQPGADAEGYAGLEDGVDYHWGELFKAAALSTLLSVGAEAGTSRDENNLVQALRSGASNSISQTGQQIVGRQLNIAPTLTIRPGFPVRIIVTRDLVIEPYGG